MCKYRGQLVVRSNAAEGWGTGVGSVAGVVALTRYVLPTCDKILHHERT